MKKTIVIFIMLLFFLTASFNSAQTTQVAAGDGTLSAAVAAASSGDIIELTTSGGVYHETDAVNITVPITIRAAEGLNVKPSIESNSATAVLQIADGGALSLQGVLIDGNSGSGTTSYAVLAAAGAKYDLAIDNCEFYNFVNVIYGKESEADTVIINHCLMAHVTDEKAVNFSSSGTVNDFTLTNSTIWDTNDYVVYVKAPGNSMLVDHVTIYSEGKGAEKMIYPKYAHNAVIKNSILSTAGQSSDLPLAVRLYNTDSFAEYLLTWNTAGIELKDGASIDSSKIIFEQDPLFVDPEGGNFNLFQGSPAIGFAEDGSNLGDPRWSVATDVDEPKINIPTEFDLLQNYPNPFNPSTVIEFNLAEKANVRLTVYNSLGELIKVLIIGEFNPGVYHSVWNGTDESGAKVTGGVYFYQFKANDFVMTKKMILMK